MTIERTRRIAIIGASGKLGQYMIQHALDRGYEVVGVCRPESVGKLARFGDRIAVMPGRTDDRDVIRRAVAGCDAVLTVLVPWGMTQYATGTAQALKIVPSVIGPGPSLGRGVAIWLSNDARRAPVRIESELVVGRFVLALR